MLRKIITINEDLCNGCGACATACHEGAIEMIDGKAVLTREDYCDGLGDCLPACPTGAISFEVRNTPAYVAPKAAIEKEADQRPAPVRSRLAQWPCQIRLVPVNAPYFDRADLLIAADCSAFTYGNFHNDFMKNRITLIGCPKLDAINYAQKLTEIIKNNDINSILTVRMEVPCCFGIELAVKKAIMASEKIIEHQIVTISTDGKIL